jgi:integrase
VASIHVQKNRTGNTYRVSWRDDGRQRTLTFANPARAQWFRTLQEGHGTEEALRVLELHEIGRRVPTVAEWLDLYIDGLTGVQPATVNRYRAYARDDINPFMGSLPLTAVTESTIRRWVQALRGSGKTIANKHGFVSAAFKQAAKSGLIVANPCQDTRLPRTGREEMVILTPDEFRLLHGFIPRARWQDLAAWLLATGMRFSEATALTAAEINLDEETCRIWRAWKYSGNYRPELGPPKSRKSVRTINLPPEALDVIDLSTPSWLFTNGAGNPVRAQEFYNGGWKPGLERAAAAGLRKKPRVHDLRHTCVSWMIQQGVPLPVIQQHLGHENISTTIDTYGHLDRQSARAAADAISAVLGRETSN